ncbi:Fur family transcriptional regulator [Pontibacillus litoralis]|uniref:Fur family transcriptional regulator n=1 Tax=Pontibacillus litoralis JSM 072002 TaxID=1385512 RepID=A0A0A5FWG2_9BACI|nr:Fur family transcriptional regulator [Pontibacillus litoralis]KGX85121.1 Fur family transcriptional regulator [Pontibacillus litoralis JSM 072002]
MNTTKALHILKDNGYKHTKQRKKLLHLLQLYDQYLSVKQIWTDFQEDFPGASYDTVYRNLYTLSELGIIESTQLNGEKHFRFHCDTHGHHHHFICTDCGKTSPIDICPMDDVRGMLPEHQIENHTFEVYGKCPRCH